MIIRNACMDDANAMLAIYTPYVNQTAITFEFDAPTLEEFQHRMRSVMSKYPWLVAEENGVIMGYSYASTFKDRAAYQWSVETSIYVDVKYRHKGIGQLLHDHLEQALREQGILNMNACIAYLEHEDEYLPLDSVRFHERMGYQRVAHFHQCGRKFDRWYDMIWMEKLIGEHR